MHKLLNVKTHEEASNNKDYSCFFPATPLTDVREFSAENEFTNYGDSLSKTSVQAKYFNNLKGGVIMSRKLQRGFTLIELLIVIVIIGILAAVVIGVLNPVQQQNRARDAAARSSLSKMALSTKSLHVSQSRTSNRAPSTPEFAAGLANLTADAECDTSVAGYTVTSPDICSFQVEGIALPNDCAASGVGGVTDAFNGTGAAPCAFIYSRLDGNTFNIGYKTSAEPREMILFMYQEDPVTSEVYEGFFTCPITVDVQSVQINTANTQTATDGTVTCNILN